MKAYSTTYEEVADDYLELNLKLSYMVEDFLELLKRNNTEEQDDNG